MTDHHITPPPELVRQWLLEYYGGDLGEVSPEEMYVARCAAQWGADQEVGACCQWLVLNGYDLVASKFHAARRPKPPSLKRVALLQLDTLNADLGLEGKGVDLSQIRRALEQLDD